jgi:RND family efflux transporter MFP subunit
MKTLFKSMVIVGAVVMASACGGNNNQAQNEKAVVDTTPTVAVEQVTRRDVPQEVVYSTTVQAFVKNNIAPQSVNRIAQINVEIGDNVTKGQVLAKMDQVQLQTVENQMRQAELQMKNNEVEYGRLKGLYDAGGLSKSDLDAIELGYEASKIAYNNAKKQYENLKENSVLLSPINGVVTARNYDAGDMYAMSAPIFTVEQISPVKLLVGVSESDYSKVHTGDAVTITADALPGQEFAGKINRIYPTVDPATRTFTVEVKVENEDKALRPGMFARATVTFGINNSIIVPDVAVIKQQGSGERFVYVLNEDGTVSYTKVILGRRLGAEYEVLEGLSDGAKVVTGGMIRLKDGVKVNVNE